MSKSAVALPIVAVVGNPNAGKTTLFNALTGSTQKVANYPGVTVERVSAKVRLGEAEAEFLDIPGLYSLTAMSEDEHVAVRSLSGELNEKPSALICVLDAANLERNLFLYSQLTTLGIPIVVALTMTDRLPRQGLSLDTPLLSQKLGAPVFEVVSHRSVGIESLRKEIFDLLDRPRAASYPVFGDGDPDARYEWASTLAKEVVRSAAPSPTKTRTDRIDAFLMHRFWGLLFFVLVMYAVFQSIYSLAGPLMDAIDWAVGSLGSVVSGWLEGSPFFQSLVVDGLITGVGSAIIFLPQILILFLFIALLEGSGYLARAAFLMDRLLGWCGLNGRAFIPLLSSFACAIPGIMAARVMPDPKSRLATILVAPLMSCSARLPVYTVLIGAFIQPKFGAFWAGFALFAMHFLGLVVAIPVVWALNRNVIKGKRLPFLLELPPYQWPKLRDVLTTMLQRAKVFLSTAGTIIVAMSIVIWAMSSFPKLSAEQEAAVRTEFASSGQLDEGEIEAKIQERQREKSWLGTIGKALEPVFLPAGFDWRITTSILAAFPAREVVVPSMGILFGLGDDEERISLKLSDTLNRATWPDGRPLFTHWTAIGLMVFFALCAQCMATLATVKRETNSWKWAVFMFVYMTGLAYLGAIFVHQLGRWFG